MLKILIPSNTEDFTKKVLEKYPTLGLGLQETCRKESSDSLSTEVLAPYSTQIEGNKATLNFKKIAVSATSYQVLLEIDDTQNQEIKFEDWHTEEIASAIARRMDQTVLDALNKATDITEISTTVSGSSSNLKFLHVTKVYEHLEENNITGDLFFLTSKSGIHSLSQDEKVDLKPSLKDIIKFDYYGFKWKKITNMQEGGLIKNPSTNIRTCYSYSKKAIAFLMVNDMKTTYNKDTASIRTSFSIGAKILNPKGIVRIFIDESKT